MFDVGKPSKPGALYSCQCVVLICIILKFDKLSCFDKCAGLCDDQDDCDLLRKLQAFHT